MVTAICCYDECDRDATDHDHDGDEACALHAAQSERYVVVSRLDSDGDPLSSEQAERVVGLLADRGWDIEIRAPWRGEAEGTYRRSPGGTLQILGYSIRVPEPLEEALRWAYDAAIAA